MSRRYRDRRGFPLKKLRRRLGMTQAEFADVLCITRNYLARLEREDDDPSPMLQKLIDYVEKDPDLVEHGARRRGRRKGS